MARALFAGVFVCLVGLGVLGVRVWQLEQQLASAERRLGSQHGAAQATDATIGPVKAVGLEPRLAEVEKGLRALRDDLRTLERATEGSMAVPSQEAAADPRHILSVVKSEAERIRDRQLAFARTRWTEGRKAALDRFSVEQKLDPEQKSQIEELLDDESGKLVQLLRRPDAVENPEQLAADWNAVLRDTDRAARGVLEPSQVPAWDWARTIERRVLWPWLPVE